MSNLSFFNMFSSNAMSTLWQKLHDLLYKISVTISITKERFEINSLPSELELDILLRVSSKQLQRCKSVSKHWRDLISTQEFVDAYRLRHRLDNRFEGSFLIFSESFSIAIDIRSNGLTPRRLKRPDIRLKGLDFVGSCNGLACFRSPVNETFDQRRVNERRIYRLWLYNPETEAFRALPELITGDRCDKPGVFLHQGNDLFCYDGLSDDYNIYSLIRRSEISINVRHCSINVYRCIYIYSFKANSWKFKVIKEEPWFFGRYELGKVIAINRNSLYYCCRTLGTHHVVGVVRFDMSNEKLFVVRLPRSGSYRGNKWELTTLGGRLHVINTKFEPWSRLEIWVMKEDEFSWTKLFYCSLIDTSVRQLFRVHELVYAYSEDGREILIGPKGFLNSFVRCNIETQKVTFDTIEVDPCFINAFGCRVVPLLSSSVSHID